MKYLLNLPPTPEAQALNVDWNRLDQELQLVYKLDQESRDYIFAGEYDTEADDIEDDENAIIVPVSSTYIGPILWSANTVFSNILSSSGDTPHDQQGKSTSWHNLATAAGIAWNCHAQQNVFYDCFTGQQVANTPQKTYACDNTIVGGHVMPVQRPSTVARNSIVYVLPICHNHNSMGINHNGQTPGNGNGFFMRTNANTAVIQLKGYMPNNMILPKLVNAPII